MAKRSRSANRRLLSKARAEFINKPLAIDARSLADIQAAIESRDINELRSILAMDDGEDMESSCPESPTMQIVGGVAIIPVRGVLRDEVDWMVHWAGCSSYQLIEQDVSKAAADSNVKAILLWCNSPGGQASGAKRCADTIAAVTNKPVVSFVQGTCASACYWIASATDSIYSTPDSLVGSIGAIYTHSEISGMAKQVGYSFTVFTNKDSPKKGYGNPYQPLSADAKETLQAFVDSFGNQFIADISANRGVSSEKVIANYGKGDSFLATEAKNRDMVDSIVANVQEVLLSITSENNTASSVSPVIPEEPKPTQPVQSRTPISGEKKVKRIKAQLFALGLIDSIEASDEVAKAALAGFFAARGQDVPADEAEQLKAFRVPAAPVAAAPVNPIQEAHNREQAEAKAAAVANKSSIAELQASAALINNAAGATKVTSDMVLASVAAGHSPKEAVEAWNKQLSPTEQPAASAKVEHLGSGAERFAADAIDALLYRATSTPGRRRGANAAESKVAKPNISDSALALTNRPLWAIAAECLKMSGQNVDMYGDRELICRSAMEMGQPGQRHAFYSQHESRQFVSASGAPFARPGDFPNILSGLANKFLDSIEMDEWSYPEWSAVWPTGFGDFKPTTMMNRGTPDELSEVLDSGNFTELQQAEEVLSYIFCRRFGNKWGWTPVMVANDDLGAFAEGMLGLDEAWETTQHRLCLALLTSNGTLLDGSALFASRTNGNNDRTSGAAPSDSEWAAMETLYADIKGVGSTTRRVRGSLNTVLCPTGTQHQEARRTFDPLGVAGLEAKVAATSSNVGLYRGLVNVIGEPELRDDSVATRYYGFRNPTQLRTATIVRGYFNGFGAAGRRERWYEPENKTTWISIEGRIGVAVKNWRYVVRNKGAA